MANKQERMLGWCVEALAGKADVPPAQLEPSTPRPARTTAKVSNLGLSSYYSRLVGELVDMPFVVGYSTLSETDTQQRYPTRYTYDRMIKHRDQPTVQRRPTRYTYDLTIEHRDQPTVQRRPTRQDWIGTPTIIYRVEHKDELSSRGVFCSGPYRHYAYDLSYSFRHYSLPSGREDKNCTPDSAYHCGFESWEKLCSWFDLACRAWLQERGYVVRVYHGFAKHGDKQVGVSDKHPLTLLWESDDMGCEISRETFERWVSEDFTPEVQPGRLRKEAV